VRAPSPDPNENPFPGLRPFKESEEHLFFGRENQVDAMVDKLAATHFLAVVGTSGSGKSSLVNCGLRPALRRGQMASSGTAWRIAQFRPGRDPIGALADVLAEDGLLFSNFKTTGLSLAQIIRATLRMSKLGLIDIFEQANPGPDVNLLVVVDQFEELFRYRRLNTAAEEKEMAEQATAFVNLLLEVRERAPKNVFVALTMRSDFLGDCTQFPGLAEAINAGQYLVPRLTRDERRAAIEGPIRVMGAEVSPVLLTRLVNDVGDNPDQLSILQHALNRTWAYWRKLGGEGPIDLVHYETIGTMAEALDRHAERAFRKLADDRQRWICEKLFKALTDKTDARGVRRPTTVETLCALTDTTAAELTQVINAFRKPSRSFLMPPAPPEGTAMETELRKETIVDISHESLMRVWKQLIHWADEEARSAGTYRRLAETAQRYPKSAGLLTDPELQLTLDWRDENRPNETWAARYHDGFAAAMSFLEQSGKARDEQEREEEERHERELATARERAEAARERAEESRNYAEEARKNAEEKERTAKRMGNLALFAVGIAMVAVLIGGLAVYYAGLAHSNQTRANEYLGEVQTTESRNLAKATELNPNDLATKILLALEALPDRGKERPFVAEAEKILAAGLNDNLELAVFGGHDSDVVSVAVTPNGTRIVTGLSDGTVVVWSIDTHARLLHFKGHRGSVWSVAVSQDRIVTAGADRAVRVWDIATGGQLLELAGHAAAVWGVAVSRDGSRILSGSSDNTARVWDAATGNMLLLLKGHARPVRSVAFSPDGSRLVTGSSDSTIIVWDAITGERLRQLTGHMRVIRSLVFSPDGTRIISASDDGTARLWDAFSGEEIRQMKVPGKSLTSVDISADGARIVTGAEDGVVREWSAETGVARLQFDGHTNSITGVAFMPDGRRLVSSSGDGTTRLWDTATHVPRTPQFRLQGHSGLIRSVKITPDGTRLVTASDDTSARVWSARNGAELRRLIGHTGTVYAVAITADGKRIVTASADHTARVWNADTGAELQNFTGHRDGVNAVAVMPDGTRAVTGSSDGTARIWNMATGEELFLLRNNGGPVLCVAVTPDGTAVAVGSADGFVRMYDVANGAELRHFVDNVSVAAGTIALTPDGKKLVTGSSDGVLRIYDALTGRGLTRLRGHTAPVYDVTVTLDGTAVISGSQDNTVRVWNLSNGTESYQLADQPKAVLAVAVTADGAGVVVASDNDAWMWQMSQLRPPPQRGSGTSVFHQALVDQAKSMVPRCLTITQRKAFLLSPSPPHWCVQMHKFPYDTAYWDAWEAERKEEAHDEDTSSAYGDFSDAALKAGDFRRALEAADLGILFGPQQLWIRMNRAHANMFLGRFKEAREEYLAHRGEMLNDSMTWEKSVVKDFQNLRDAGQANDLMTEIEKEFRSGLAKKK
jgi:WD40 repeat protein